MALLGSSVVTAIITTIANRSKTRSEANLINSEAEGKSSSASKTNEEVNQMLFDRMTKALDRSETKMVELQTQFFALKQKCDDDTLKLRGKNQELSMRLSMLEGAFQDLPLPQWLKDTDGKMLSLNKAYEDMFLRPMSKTSQDYIGKTDEDVWGPEIAAKFRQNDQEAERNGKGFWIGIEPIWVQNNDISKHWWIFNYVRYVGETPVGGAGLALPIKDADLTKLNDGYTSTN